MPTDTQIDAEDELASLCGMLNASYARLVAITAVALDDESWALAGVRSPEHWLTMRAGLSPFHARQIVTVARRNGELPSVMAEFANGQLSLDQVSVVAIYAPAHMEASVAELAIHASVPQLRRVLSRYSFDPPAPDGYAQQSTTFPASTSNSAISNSSISNRPATARLRAPRPARWVARPAPPRPGTASDSCKTGPAPPPN